MQIIKRTGQVEEPTEVPEAGVDLPSDMATDDVNPPETSNAAAASEDGSKFVAEINEVWRFCSLGRTTRNKTINYSWFQIFVH